MRDFKKNVVVIICFFILFFPFSNVYAEEYTINSNDIFREYKTILVDMDKAFSYLKDAYNLKDDNKLIDKLSELNFYKKSSSGKCTSANTSSSKGYIYNYGYRSKTTLTNTHKISVDKTKKQIYVPDIYYICVEQGALYDLYSKSSNVLIDDSVYVDIETKNGKNYLPLYFFSSIPGVDVKIDGKIIYQSTNYYDSISALNKNGSHSIKLIVDPISSTNYNKIANNYSNSNKYSYYGEEDGALWREEAKKRIEKYRKGNLHVIVKDSNGKIINNATVNIKMRDNIFKFGSAISRINEKGSTSHDFDGDTETTLDDITSEYFNGIGSTAVFSANHGGASKEKSQIKLLSDAKKKGINYSRGHNLFWDYWRTGNLSNTIENIIGKKDDNDSQNITMSYVRKKYDEFNKDGNYTKKEKDQINDWIVILKGNFVNFVHEYIKKTVEANPNVDEWDLFNELANTTYIRYYLYGQNEKGIQNFLTVGKRNDGWYEFLPEEKSRDANGKITYNVASITKNTEGGKEEYDSWEEFENRFEKNDYSEFIDFLIGCIDFYRSKTNKLMVINESKVNGIYSSSINKDNKPSQLDDNKSIYQARWMFKLINEKLKKNKKKPIDAIGFENHVRKRFNITPNSYYNAYIKFLNDSGVSRGRITEYDSCRLCDASERIKDSSDTNLNQLRANYIKDTVIAAYSNTKLDLFWIWAFTFDLLPAEQKAYKDTVYEWLNYEQKFVTDDKGQVEARLHKGEYEINVSYNGKSKTQSIIVSSGTNKFEIKINDSVNGDIIGDVDGNGKVTVLDYLMIRKHILKIKLLTDKEKKSSDLNNDGKISVIDYVSIRNILLNK